MTRTRTAATAALAISSALVLAACGGGSSTDSGGSDLTGAVRVDGSSTVYPLTALAAETSCRQPACRSPSPLRHRRSFEKFCAERPTPRCVSRHQG